MAEMENWYPKIQGLELLMILFAFSLNSASLHTYGPLQDILGQDMVYLELFIDRLNITFLM
jgi:hypothetical protein